MTTLTTILNKKQNKQNMEIILKQDGNNKQIRTINEHQWNTLNIILKQYKTIKSIRK